jgi:hypothetical protein
MTEPSVVEIAFERAWRVYLMMHDHIDRNDARREALVSHIRALWREGQGDSESLAVAGLKFLRQLDVGRSSEEE